MVLTWKPIDEKGPRKETDAGQRRAKARLVIRGFKDPDLGKYQTNSPTLSRAARSALIGLAVHLSFRIFSLDAKTAFLSGDASRRPKPLYAALPRDLLEALKLPEDTIALLKKAVYGLAETPVA